MENRRNLIIAVVLCIGILIVWDRFFMPKAQAPAPASPTAASQGKGEQEAAKPAVADQANNGTAPAVRGAEQTFTLQSSVARFVLSNYGAALKAVYLTEEKFRAGKSNAGGDAAAPLEVLRAPADAEGAFAISVAESGFKLPADVAWEVASQDASHITFVAQVPGATLEKTFRLQSESYRLALDITVKNQSQGKQSHRLALHIPGYQDPDKKGGGIFSYAVASVEEMVCHVKGSIERHSVSDLKDEPRSYAGVVRWVAADERFFTLAAVPPTQLLDSERRCEQRSLGDDRGEVVLTLDAQSLAAGQAITYPFTLYTGPKYRQQLAKVQAADIPGLAASKAGKTSAEVDLEASVNVSFAFISRPMMLTLRAFFGLTGNWGLAIILLTILVKLITFYPAHRALLSGKRMARLAPKVAELREKYGNDRERLGRETMALYKSQGVNVLGGCVPSLIQMPIWIALYSTLSYSVELYRANFVGYIHDLSAPDPYYLLPLVMGVTMFIQMRMTPAGTDPQQQKIMSVMMPIMFTFFQIFLPSGLALYVLTNYLLGIVHQVIVNRLDKASQSPKTTNPAKPAKAAR